MSNNIFYLAFLFLVVATNFVIVFFIRKHPEKISGFKLEGSENEIVEKGQTIGTVGETASFEIADEPHLHFEMLKDSIYVDPSIYIK